MRKSAKGDQARPPERAFRFKWRLIRPGDVICSTIPDGRISRLIRTLTWSRFSHVSLCVEAKGCIEANENVTRFSLVRVGFLDPANVRVIRLRERAGSKASEIPKKAAKAAMAFLG